MTLPDPSEGGPSSSKVAKDRHLAQVKGAIPAHGSKVDRARNKDLKWKVSSKDKEQESKSLTRDELQLSSEMEDCGPVEPSPPSPPNIPGESGRTGQEHP